MNLQHSTQGDLSYCKVVHVTQKTVIAFIDLLLDTIFASIKITSSEIVL